MASGQGKSPFPKNLRHHRLLKQQQVMGQLIDDLREDVKELRKDLKDMQAGQSRLEAKLDRLLESRLTPHPQ